MKTFITAIFLSILFIAQNLSAKTNISHAIAMHGVPKYNQDFMKAINAKTRFYNKHASSC